MTLLQQGEVYSLEPIVFLTKLVESVTFDHGHVYIQDQLISLTIPTEMVWTEDAEDGQGATGGSSWVHTERTFNGSSVRRFEVVCCDVTSSLIW